MKILKSFSNFKRRHRLITIKSVVTILISSNIHTTQTEGSCTIVLHQSSWRALLLSHRTEAQAEAFELSLFCFMVSLILLNLLQSSAEDINMAHWDRIASLLRQFLEM